MNKIKTNQNDSFEYYANEVCPVCSCKSNAKIGEVYDHEYRSVDRWFSVYQCSDCSLVYLNPRPSISELGTIYPETYYSYHLSEGNDSDMSNSTQVNNKSFVRKLFYTRNIAALTKKLLESGVDTKTLRNKEVNILDIGCGTGVQLDMFKEIFHNANTFGIEIGANACKVASNKGHIIYNSNIEGCNLKSNYYDIIYSSHVIEHVGDPSVFFRVSNEHLSENGVLIIETPNTNCIDFRLFKKKNWGGYHAPRHFYLFNESNMERMAKKYEFKKISSSVYPSPVFWNWTCHSILYNSLSNKIADYLFPPVNIFYGGVRSFLILGFFAVFESFIIKITGKGSAFWISFRHGK